MKFEEVMPAMRSGKYIRQISMPKGYFFTVFNKKVLMGFTLENGSRALVPGPPVEFYSEEVLAEDWEVLE